MIKRKKIAVSQYSTQVFKKASSSLLYRILLEKVVVYVYQLKIVLELKKTATCRFFWSVIFHHTYFKFSGKVNWTARSEELFKLVNFSEVRQWQRLCKESLGKMLFNIALLHSSQCIHTSYINYYVKYLHNTDWVLVFFSLIKLFKSIESSLNSKFKI